MTRLHVDDFLPSEASCHFARTTFRSAGGGASAPEPHCHDFLELFWIEDGTGIEVGPHGRRALRPGTITLVAEDDAHGFTTDGTRCRMVNLAFRSALWRELHARLMPLAPDPFAVPALKRLEAPASCLVDLALFVEEVELGARSRLATERLLLNILWLMERERARSRTQGPAWLREAVAALTEPALLGEGTHALVRLTGRSPEHLAREARRWLGKTPTEVVNDARISYAARRLVVSEDSPLTICLDCGLANLGHFYRLFQERMHTTPQRWREQQRRIVLPGS